MQKNPLFPPNYWNLRGGKAFSSIILLIVFRGTFSVVSFLYEFRFIHFMLFSIFVFISTGLQSVMITFLQWNGACTWHQFFFLPSACLPLLPSTFHFSSLLQKMSSFLFPIIYTYQALYLYFGFIVLKRPSWYLSSHEWFISFDIMFSRWSVSLQLIQVYPALWQSSICHMETTFSPSIRLLMDMQATSQI